MTMKMMNDTAMVKSLLLLMLGLTLLREGMARKNPKVGDATLLKPGNCPPLEDNSVRVDIRILSQNQGVPIKHDFQNRSISPWDYKFLAHQAPTYTLQNITRDPNRFPSEIAEARCRHSGCINAQGEEDSSMNSVPIQQEFLVLRREPQGCSRSFRLEKVRVTVGCTCVTPIVRYTA